MRLGATYPAGRQAVVRPGFHPRGPFHRDDGCRPGQITLFPTFIPLSFQGPESWVLSPGLDCLSLKAPSVAPIPGPLQERTTQIWIRRKFLHNADADEGIGARHFKGKNHVFQRTGTAAFEHSEGQRPAQGTGMKAPPPRPGRHLHAPEGASEPP